MPDLGLVDMGDSWLMDIFRREIITPPPAPALKNERELISRGRLGKDGITEKKPFLVETRRSWYKNALLRPKTEFHQLMTEADFPVHFPVHFPEADFRYPPMLYLFERREYKERVQRPVPDAVKSLEAVQFLNSVSKSPCQVPHFDASKCGNLVLEAANSEFRTYSTQAVDVEEEHWKPTGFDVKEAAMLPRVKQYFRDDHDLDVSLPSSFSTKEDDKGGVVLSIFSIPSSASPSTIVNSLVEAARSWRSQKKKTLLLKLLPTEYDQFLYPSLEAGFTIHQVEATDMMLVQDLLAQVQPEQVEEASFDSSYNWKRRHWILDNKDVQIADSCFPSAGAYLSTKSDIYSFAVTCLEVVGARPFDVVFGQDVTIDQDLPHSNPGPGALGTPEIKQRVKHPVVADLPSSADCLEEPGDERDSESEAMNIPTDEEVLSDESGASLESHTEIATADSQGPRTEPSRKRSAASAFYDDNLFAKIRSYVNQQIEEALLPLMSALRSREEDEHKHRQKMLAVEQEKLALMRQKLECTRRSNAVPASVAK